MKNQNLKLYFVTILLPHMEMMAKKVQKGRYLFCPNGSHLALYNDQKIYVEGLIKFILDVNAGKF